MVKLLLDGQQRMTWLYGVVRGKSPKFFDGNAKAFTGLRFHLDAETFEFYQPVKMKDEPLWIDVTELMKKGTDGLGDFVSRLARNIEQRRRLRSRKRRGASLFLNETDAQITKWADNMETAMNFAAHAKGEFDRGDIGKRRSIFLALGSNLIKDKKVSVDLEKTLLPMRRLASAVREIHAALEPQEDRMEQADFDEIYSQSPIVSALWDEVRTSFMAAAGFPTPLSATVLPLAA